MEILEQHAGVPTSFCRHGEAIAEFHRKPFDQGVMEKDHIVNGTEDGGGETGGRGPVRKLLK